MECPVLDIIGKNEWESVVSSFPGRRLCCGETADPTSSHAALFLLFRLYFLVRGGPQSEKGFFGCFIWEEEID